MKEKKTRLVVHPKTQFKFNIDIQARLIKTDNCLSIFFEVYGPLNKLNIDAPERHPARTDGLWERTCFECFVATGESNAYWEFNLSPATHWNIYYFEDYRKGMREEKSFKKLPVYVEKKDNYVRVSCHVPIDKIISPHQRLKIGLSAVIRTTDGETTFWALTHPCPHPDFHQRNGFILEL